MFILTADDRIPALTVAGGSALSASMVQKDNYKTRKSHAELLGTCSIRLFQAGFCLSWCCRLIDGGLLLQEGVKTENDHINLKVAGQDGSVVQFKIKRHTALNKLMKAYCERQVCFPRWLHLTNRSCQEQAAGAFALHVYCMCNLNKRVLSFLRACRCVK